jgi:DNA-binding response OmpR family regulator
MNGFANRGFDILECASPDEALNLVQQRKRKGTIGVAVVDMSMPVMWGDVFARELALISPEIKIIFISGHSEEFLRSMGSLSESDIFFAKPYTPKLLLHKVWELLGMEVPKVAVAQGTPAAGIDPQAQLHYFAEHLDFHIENDQRVK